MQQQVTTTQPRSNLGRKFPDQSRRLPKFQRHPERFKRYRIGARDIAILSEIGAYRCLGSRHIRALLSDHPEQLISRRLQFLFHGNDPKKNGFVERLVPPPRIKQYRPGEWNPIAAMIYTLTREGAQLLRDHGEEVDWRPSHRLMASSIRHEADVANFRVCLELALENHPRASFDGWLHEEDVRDEFYIEARGKKTRHAFNPDGYARLRINGESLNLFLEVDRSTEPLQGEYGRIDRKLESAWWYADREETSPYWTRYADSNPKARYFLFVTSGGEQRVKNMIGTLAGIEAFKGRGLKQFLFGRTDFSIEKPETILATIWHRMDKIQTDSRGRVTGYTTEPVSLIG